MRVRSTGIMAAMLGFVAAATYRGVKDTRTPLIAAVGAMCTNLVLTPLFLYGELGGREPEAGGGQVACCQSQRKTP
jgi:Na+-driven multidrug efflux pump